jgi:hypothetical protein
MFFHNLQFVTKQIITVFFKKRERERVDKRTLSVVRIVGMVIIYNIFLFKNILKKLFLILTHQNNIKI